MTFQWLDFVRSRNIEFVTSGAHTAPGNIYIECPWCANDKKYMGLHEHSTKWGCWKSAQHSGIKPHRLIQALAGCTWEEANAITQGSGPVRDSLDDLLVQLDSDSAQSEEVPSPTLEYPDEFSSATMHMAPRHYLRKRGFPNAVEVCHLYDLQYSTRGEWQQRLIMPIHRGGDLLGWTGRAVVPAELRYKTEGKVGDLIWNYDPILVTGGDWLVICEGPLDAMKIDYFGLGHNVNAVGILGLAMTPGKIAALTRLAEVHYHVAILLDQTEEGNALAMQSKLAFLSPEVWTLPNGIKDPGEMSGEFVDQYLEDMISS